MANEKSKKIKSPPSFDNLNFPVYAVLSHKDFIFVAGGGGKSKTGVQNGVAWFRQSNLAKPAYELAGFYEFPPDFGAPMNMTLVKDEFLLVGIDNYCHVLRMDAEKKSMVLKEKFNTDKNGDDPYQKVIKSTLDGSLVATGGTDGIVRLYDSRDIGSYFAPTASNLELKDHKSEISDLTFTDSGEYLASVSQEYVCIWAIKESKKVEAELITKLDANILNKNGDFKFKYARFSGSVLLTVALDKKRQAYVSRFDTKDWKILLNRLVSRKPITAFAVDPTGIYLAFGTNEGAVGLVNANSLRPQWLANRAHGFTVTSMTFNEEGTQVISGSPDHQCKLFSVISRVGYIQKALLLFALISVLLAVYFGSQEVPKEYFQIMLNLMINLSDEFYHIFFNQTSSPPTIK